MLVSIFIQDFPEFPLPPPDDEDATIDTVVNKNFPDQVAQAATPTAAKTLNPFKQDYNFDDQANDNIGKISDILEDAFATPQLESLNPLWGNDALKPQMMTEESDVSQKIVDANEFVQQDVGQTLSSPKMVISIFFFHVLLVGLLNNILFRSISKTYVRCFMKTSSSSSIYSAHVSNLSLCTSHRGPHRPKIDFTKKHFKHIK